MVENYHHAPRPGPRASRRAPAAVCSTYSLSAPRTFRRMRRQAKIGRPRTSHSFLAIDIAFYFLTHEWLGRWSRDASATSSLRFRISVLRFDVLLVVLVSAFFFGRHSLSPGTRSPGVSAQTLAQSGLIGPKRRRRRGSHRRAGRPPSSRFLLILQSPTEEDPVRHISPEVRPYWRNDRSCVATTE